MIVMAVLTAFGWRSKSGPVKDLLFKCHFTHHLLALIVDWYTESALGIKAKAWQQGMFTPYPFFTFIVLFMWMTDKRRDQDAEDRERNGM